MSPSARQRSLLMIVAMSLGLAACISPQGRVVADDEVVGKPAGVSGAQGAHSKLMGGETQQWRAGQLWYHISGGEQGRLQLRLRLLDPPERTSLFLPGAWAGRDDYAKAIRIQSATGPSGPLPLTLLRDQGRLDIVAKDQAWIELRYEVNLSKRRSEQERLEPQRLGEAGFLAYAPTFLVLPSERLARQLSQIPIEVQLPDTIEVLTTWPLKRPPSPSKRAGYTTYGYVAADIGELRDAFVVAQQALVQVRDPERALSIAYAPSYKGDTQAMTALIERVLSAYITRFGSPGPVAVFVHSPASSQRAGGAKGKGAGVRWGTGRRGGFVLELPATASVDDEMSLLIAHEAFHLWNGHKLVPDGAQEQRTRWFKEGLTHYVALQTLGQLRLCSTRRLLDELAMASHRYTQANTRSSDAQWAARYPYDRGLLLAAAIDLQLRRESQGKRTLDAWLLKLFERAQQPRWLYDEDKLFAELRALDPSPGLGKLWSQQVKQELSLDLEAMYLKMGLHWLPQTAQRSPRLIPLDGSSGMYREMFGLSHP